MSAQYVLMAADLGLSVLSYRAQTRAIKAQGRLERQQIRFAAERDALERTEALQTNLSQQRSATAANNVTGGRTGRLFEAQSRLRAMRAQGAADMQTMYQTRASLAGQALQRSQASSQLISGLMETAQQGVNLFGAERAAGLLGGMA